MTDDSKLAMNSGKALNLPNSGMTMSEAAAAAVMVDDDETGRRDGRDGMSDLRMGRNLL